jgi:hypothetical protein
MTKHFGHNAGVQDNIYTLNPDLVLATTMGKALLAHNSGTLHKSKGKDLAEVLVDDSILNQVCASFSP